jgi:hypothetical protein
MTIEHNNQNYQINQNESVKQPRPRPMSQEAINIIRHEFKTFGADPRELITKRKNILTGCVSTSEKSPVRGFLNNFGKQSFAARTRMPRALMPWLEIAAGEPVKGNAVCSLGRRFPAPDTRSS